MAFTAKAPSQERLRKEEGSTKFVLPSFRTIPKNRSSLCLWIKVILYSPWSLRSKYNSAYAEYHCEAIKLAAGEYNWKNLVLWTRGDFINVSVLTTYLFVICRALLGVIFLLRKSDIATSPQWYYIRPHTCEANITRQKAEYHCVAISLAVRRI